MSWDRFSAVSLPHTLQTATLVCETGPLIDLGSLRPSSRFVTPRRQAPRAKGFRERRVQDVAADLLNRVDDQVWLRRRGSAHSSEGQPCIG